MNHDVENFDEELLRTTTLIFKRYRDTSVILIKTYYCLYVLRLSVPDLVFQDFFQDLAIYDVIKNIRNEKKIENIKKNTKNSLRIFAQKCLEMSIFTTCKIIKNSVLMNHHLTFQMNKQKKIILNFRAKIIGNIRNVASKGVMQNSYFTQKYYRQMAPENSAVSPQRPLSSKSRTFKKKIIL